MPQQTNSGSPCAACRGAHRPHTCEKAQRAVPEKAQRQTSHAHNTKPLECGAKLLCQWRDQEKKTCEILERQQTETGEWEYCARAASSRSHRPWPQTL